MQVLVVNAGSTSLKLSLVGPGDVSTAVESLDAVPSGVAAVVARETPPVIGDPREPGSTGGEDDQADAERVHR